MEKAARTRLVALALLLAVAAPLLIVALAGSGGDDGDERPAGLRVERSPGGLPEITVTSRTAPTTTHRNGPGPA
jgi:hypothetical protein